MPAHRDDQTPSPRRPDRPAGTEERAELLTAARTGQRATTLVLVAVLLLSLPQPWAAVGLLPAVAALALGIRAAYLHGRGSRWGWSAWSLLAAVFAFYLLGFGGLRTAYPAATDAWATCSSGANTHIAQADCDQALDRATPDWVRGLLGAG